MYGRGTGGGWNHGRVGGVAFLYIHAKVAASLAQIKTKTPETEDANVRELVNQLKQALRYMPGKTLDRIERFVECGTFEVSKFKPDPAAARFFAEGMRSLETTIVAMAAMTERRGQPDRKKIGGKKLGRQFAALARLGLVNKLSIIWMLEPYRQSRGTPAPVTGAPRFARA